VLVYPPSLNATTGKQIWEFDQFAGLGSDQLIGTWRIGAMETISGYFSARAMSISRQSFSLPFTQPPPLIRSTENNTSSSPVAAESGEPEVEMPISLLLCPEIEWERDFPDNLSAEKAPY